MRHAQFRWKIWSELQLTICFAITVAFISYQRSFMIRRDECGYVREAYSPCGGIWVKSDKTMIQSEFGAADESFFRISG